MRVSYFLHRDVTYLELACTERADCKPEETTTCRLSPALSATLYASHFKHHLDGPRLVSDELCSSFVSRQGTYQLIEVTGCLVYLYAQQMVHRDLNNVSTFLECITPFFRHAIAGDHLH
jgi:hypothetical protein